MNISTNFPTLSPQPISRIQNIEPNFDAASAEAADQARFLPQAQQTLTAKNVADLQQSQALGLVSTALSNLGMTVSGFTFQNSAQTPDAAALTQDATAFVAAYNHAIGQISLASQNGTDNATETSVNKTQSTLGRLGAQMDQNVQTAQAAGSYSVNTAAGLGITTNADGTLALDTNALALAVQNDPNGTAAALFGDTQNNTQGFFQTTHQLVGLWTDPATGDLATEQRALSQDALNESSYANQVGYAVSSYQNTLKSHYAAVEETLANLNAEQAVLQATLESTQTSANSLAQPSWQTSGLPTPNTTYEQTLLAS